jgi:hypothetical protein
MDVMPKWADVILIPLISILLAAILPGFAYCLDDLPRGPQKTTGQDVVLRPLIGE